MKKLLTILGACVLLFSMTVGAQAAPVTLTFDEIPAWNSVTPYIGEQFAAMGIHFIPNPQIPGQDGGIYDSGMLSGLVTDGSQYCGVSTSTGNAGLTITFDTDQTMVTIDYTALRTTTGAIWVFDNGTETWAALPTVFTAGAGSITVGNGVAIFDMALVATTLSATSPNTVAFDNIDFNGNPYPVAPVAAFIGIPTSGDAPLTVDFTDDSTGGTPTSWSWDFGDGSPLETTQDTSHQYTTAGTYDVSLTVTNATGSDTATELGYITVNEPLAPPVAAFSGIPTSGDAPLTVNFTDDSTGGTPTSWSWDFGDGSPLETTQDTSHQYTTAGTYDVSLTVTNAAGSDTATELGYITVTGAPPVTPSIVGPILLPLVLD